MENVRTSGGMKTIVLLLTAMLFLVQGAVAQGQADLAQVGQDIEPAIPAVGDWSGYSVSLSADGRRLAVGTPGGYWIPESSDLGSVRVYEWRGRAWSQLGEDIVGESAGDRSGWSVSLSADGSRVAIGAPKNDENGSDAGHVRVYGLFEGTWIKLGQDIDGESAEDWSGWSVSLSEDGNRVAIGARGNDGNGSDAGHVRVYVLFEGEWIQLGQDIDGEAEGDGSGFSVSLSTTGNRLAVGAPYNDENGLAAGSVRIYDLVQGAWVQVGVDIDGGVANDRSGKSVSLSANGSRIAIGAPGATSSGVGRVKIYSLVGNGRTQLGSDIVGETAGDNSGRSVSLNADGSRVAIGAYRNDENGQDAGHVRIYDLNGNTWLRSTRDIDGEAAGDESGRSVSLSADGRRVAIGAPRNNNGENGFESGHVRVFYMQFLEAVTLTAESSQGGVIAGAGSGVYPLGATVTLSANPSPGYVFTRWTGDAVGAGNPLSLQMSQDRVVSAIFRQDQRDTDGDGLNNYQELVVYRTDPNVSDSDGDCFNDGFEVSAGSDPRGRQDTPATDENGRIPITLRNVSIGPGQDIILLGFPSACGKSYRIEESLDLQNWTTWASGIPGTGESIQRFAPMRGPKAFLRVSEE